MASPEGKEPLLSRRAGRLPPVNDLWRPRSGTEREGGPAGSRPGPVADSPSGEAPLRSPPGSCRRALRVGEPPNVPWRYARPAFFPNDRTGRQRARSGDKLPFRGMPKLRPSVSSLTHRRTCVRYVRKLRHVAQKERLPKMGSLTGEDCGVACRRLKATWQGLLPFRGRTGSGAVTRHVTGSDVLR